MVVALVALFVSLAGTAEAAFLVSKNSQVAPHVISGAAGPADDTHNLIKGSVGARDLHARAVTTGKLADGSVTGAKVADGTIGAADMVQGLPCAIAVPGGAITSDNFPVCGEVQVAQVSAGVYCITLPYLASGGAVTVAPDPLMKAFPVAFLALNEPVTLEGFHCDSTANALVTTYDAAGGDLASESFSVIFSR
jgi:hypothetical protein